MLPMIAFRALNGLEGGPIEDCDGLLASGRKASDGAEDMLTRMPPKLRRERFLGELKSITTLTTHVGAAESWFGSVLVKFDLNFNLV